MTTEENMIGILYNNCYGGYMPSMKAEELYNQRICKTNDNGTDDDVVPFYQLDRHDPLIVQIFHELGKEFNDEQQGTNIKLVEIPEKYKNYYEIEEYDGVENVVVDYHRYIVDKITEISSSGDNNQDCMYFIRKLLSESQQEKRIHVRKLTVLG